MRCGGPIAQGLLENAVGGAREAGLTGLRAQSAVFLVHTEVSGRRAGNQARN